MSANYVIKILTLGDTNVGKSSIVLRFVSDKFEDKMFSTIGIDFKSKFIKLGNQSIKVLLWDTAGQEKFQNIAKQYYNGANGVFLVFDITDKKSFDRIDFWLNELKEHNKLEELHVVLVGNKIDNEDQRAIQYEEANNYAKTNNIKYYEVSAKTNKGLNTLFNETIKETTKKVLSKMEQPEDYDDKLRLSILDKNELNSKKNRCCF